jgi:hypothetical protein
MNVDQLLHKIIKEEDEYTRLNLSKKDFSTLTSLHDTITGSFYITENQGRLILKILKENQKKLSKFSSEIEESVTAPVWLKSFRPVESIKKFFIENIGTDDPCLVIEVTYNSQIRKMLNAKMTNLEEFGQADGFKTFKVALTEKNIIILYELLEPLQFEIDLTINSHYTTIKSWSKSDVENQFFVDNITSKTLHKHLAQDGDTDIFKDPLVLVDRSMRYKFTTNIRKNHGENLTEHIANRSKTRVWIDKNQHSLSDIISSLKQLHRLPLMLVFEIQEPAKFQEHLDTLSYALEKNEIFDNIGIYFRLANTDDGKKFNQAIANKQYNKMLDNTTQVAVVQSGKLPKFFLKNTWTPMSIINIDPRMGSRHGKTAVYSNCCDLIIDYAAEQPIDESSRTGAWR